MLLLCFPFYAAFTENGHLCTGTFGRYAGHLSTGTCCGNVFTLRWVWLRILYAPTRFNHLPNHIDNEVIIPAQGCAVNSDPIDIGGWADNQARAALERRMAGFSLLCLLWFCSSFIAFLTSETFKTPVVRPPLAPAVQ